MPQSAWLPFPGASQSRMAAAVPGLVCTFQLLRMAKGVENRVLAFPGHSPGASHSTSAHVLGPNLVTWSPHVWRESGKYRLYSVGSPVQLKVEGSIIRTEGGMAPGGPQGACHHWLEPRSLLSIPMTSLGFDPERFLFP